MIVNLNWVYISPTTKGYIWLFFPDFPQNVYGKRYFMKKRRLLFGLVACGLLFSSASQLGSQLLSHTNPIKSAIADGDDHVANDNYFIWDLSIATYDTATATEVIWGSDYATMTVDKGSASTNANNYLGGDSNNRTSSRFYSKSSLTISPKESYRIASLVFTATSNNYANSLKNSTWTNATSAVSDNVVTITVSDSTKDISAAISGTCGFTAVRVNLASDVVGPTITLSSEQSYTYVNTDLQIQAAFAGYDTDPTELLWDSSDETVATINDNGLLHPIKAGVTTVTATDGNVLSNGLSITVYPDTTISYSVSETLVIFETFLPKTSPNNTTIHGIYKTFGKVKDITTAYSSQHDNITIVLEDLEDNTKTLSCYRLSGGEDLQIGDTILVTGSLSIYSGEYQYAAAATYVAYVPPAATPKEQLQQQRTASSLYYQYTKTTSGEAVIDTFDNEKIGVSGTTYTDWENITATSSAVYTGNTAGGNNAIQLRTNKNSSGIVTTTSGGKAAKVTVTWNTNTSAGRILDIYGSNTAYTATTDLYDVEKQGTLLGSIAYGTATELEITGDYTYIGVRSQDGALYLDKLNIQWGGAASYTIDEAAIRYGAVIDKDLYDSLGEVQSYGVMLASEGGLEAVGADNIYEFYDTYSGDSEYSDYCNTYKILDKNYTDEIPTATPEQLTLLNKDDSCYLFNVYVDLSQYLTTKISALAYVTVGGERIFLKEVQYSVKTLAQEYIANHGFKSSDFGGSLGYLANL